MESVKRRKCIVFGMNALDCLLETYGRKAGIKRHASSCKLRFCDDVGTGHVNRSRYGDLNGFAAMVREFVGVAYRTVDSQVQVLDAVFSVRAHCQER